MVEKTRVCFVCLGNIVRSPLGESMLRHLADEAGAGHKYEVDSAGTSSWHVGEQPDSRMRRVARDHGLVYSGRSRQFVPEDLDSFDIIIAMDTTNKKNILNLSSTSSHHQKVFLMRDFDPYAGSNKSVPDPYYGGIDGFEEVYGIVERACRGLLDSLESGSIIPKKK